MDNSFHANLAARGRGAKDWSNSFTEHEYLGDGKFAASIGVGHRVFKDKATGKWLKHKITDERPAKGYVLIQSAKCCVEVYPYYAKYFDVNHEEVRLYEERWVVQRLFKAPDEWRDVGAYSPVMAVEETENSITVTVSYTTDYGALVVKYVQRDGAALKHDIAFKNTSGSTQTFRVLQRWAGIVGVKCNGKDLPLDVSEPFLAFHRADKPQREFTIAENLWGMIFNPDGSEKTEKCLQRPVKIEAHAQGMKADFIYGNWVLAQNESLIIDPDTATLSDPTEDGFLYKTYYSGVSQAAACAGCVTELADRNAVANNLFFGGDQYGYYDSEAYRSYIEWPISSIAGFVLTANPAFRYNGVSNAGTSEEINPITEEAPSGATDANLWGYIASGIAYVDPFNVEVGTDKEVDLGASARSDLQAAMDTAQSWFAIGLQSLDDECPCTEVGTIRGDIYSENKAGVDPPPTLYVEYTPPAVAVKPVWDCLSRAGDARRKVKFMPTLKLG